RTPDTAARVQARGAEGLGERSSPTVLRELSSAPLTASPSTGWGCQPGRNRGLGIAVAFKISAIRRNPPRFSLQLSSERPVCTGRGGRVFARSLIAAGSRATHEKQEAVAALIAGRLTLLEAAATFRAAGCPRPDADGESACRSVIGWVHLALCDRPERAE